MNRADAKRRRLKDGLSGDRAVVAVGAHDALTAKLIGDHPFDAVWVSGLGVATMAHVGQSFCTGSRRTGLAAGFAGALAARFPMSATRGVS